MSWWMSSSALYTIDLRIDLLCMVAALSQTQQLAKGRHACWQLPSLVLSSLLCMYHMGRISQFLFAQLGLQLAKNCSLQKNCLVVVSCLLSMKKDVSLAIDCEWGETSLMFTVPIVNKERCFSCLLYLLSMKDVSQVYCTYCRWRKRWPSKEKDSFELQKDCDIGQLLGYMLGHVIMSIQRGLHSTYPWNTFGGEQGYR